VKNKPLAVIDIGTNTFRLLIAEVHKRKNYFIKEIHSERIITRLGEGVTKNRLIKKEAMKRGITALKKFNMLISQHRAQKVSAVATSALRKARNSSEFIKRIQETTGLKVKIISGRDEAKKTFSGMLAGITPPGTGLMVDIGGGSTELIFSIKDKPVLFHSLNLGVVYLADKYMKHDPPQEKDLREMVFEISKVIQSKSKPFTRLFSSDTVFIGTAGTITALAAIIQGLNTYVHNKIHKSKITIGEIQKIFSDFSSMTMKERAKLLPFEPSRFDIIVPGTLILLLLMKTFGLKKVMVSDYGLREGILLDLYRKIENKK